MNEQKVPEFYVDELSNMLLGYPISKLTFSTIGQAGASEQPNKERVLTIAISTASLAQACNFALTQIKANQNALIASASEGPDMLNNLIQGIELPAAAEKKVATIKKSRLSKSKT